MGSQSQSTALKRLGIVLDRAAEVPLGVQLAWALRARIHDGRLSPGERLPTLRDLAEGLGVNANTIRAVYQRLEHDGLLSSLQGSGTFVTAAPRTSSAVSAIAQAAAHEARQTGVDPREVAAALYVEPESGKTPAPGIDRSKEPATGPPIEGVVGEGEGQAERRRRLRTRITVLEQALAELEVRNPQLARVARAAGPHSDTGPRLLDTDELEQVQTELLRRIAAIQTAIDGPAEHAEDTAAASRPRKAPAARRKAITRPATSGT